MVAIQTQDDFSFPSMKVEVDRLAQKVFKLYEESPTERILIGIAGVPASGKSTVAKAVAQALNKLASASQSAKHPFAVDVSMDGFHLTRAQLSAMPDPVHATHRRGAEFTFDGKAFLSLVQSVHSPSSPDAIVYAPSFDHAVKDPVQNDVPIYPESRIVLFEGNYVALNREPWTSASALMTEIWFVSIDEEVAKERLWKRHVQSGICKDEKDAKHRVESTDWLNARDIVDNKIEPQETVVSQ